MKYLGVFYVIFGYPFSPGFAGFSPLFLLACILCQRISILNTDGSLAFENYRIGGDSTFSFSIGLPSIFFEINQKRINFKQFAILNAYLIKKIITKYASKKIDIKWPNDLLIKKEKVCGILQEVIDYNNKKFLIIGVGINTNFSPIIKTFKSTSLNNMGKKNINNNRILKDIQKVYENFINDIKKYTFLELKRKLVKNK